MLDFIKSISERCYNTAVRRGKDVTRDVCMLALMQEIIELKHAAAHQSTVSPSPLYARAGQMSDADFMFVYKWLLHNTEVDKIADVIISIATSYHVDPDDIALSYALDAAGELTQNVREMTEQAVALKMRYNEIRQD